jgi:hypothetical protein
MHVHENQDLIKGNTYFTKIVRTAKMIMSQITQAGKLSGVSSMIINNVESYKRYMLQ